MDLSYALFARIETQSGARVVPVHRERQHRTVGDESAPLLQSVDPVLIRELSINVREHAVRTHRDKGGHLVGSGCGCESKTAVQVAVPEVQAVVGFELRYNFFHENRESPGIEHTQNLEPIQFLHSDVQRTLHAWPARKVRPGDITT